MAQHQIDITILEEVKPISFAFQKIKIPIYVTSDSTTVTSVTSSANVSWINPKQSDTTLNAVVIELSENLSFSARTGQLTITARSTDGAISSITIDIEQLGFQFFPIWKTATYNYSTLATNVEYEIADNGVTIYAGRAYKLPQESEILIININNIASNYLSSQIENAFNNGNIYQFTDAYKRFALYVNDNLEYIYYFYNSYSYDDIEMNENGIVNTSYPINNIIDTRQYFVNSFFRPMVKDSADLHTVMYKLTELDGGNVYLNTISFNTNKQCVITDNNINQEGILTVNYNGLKTPSAKMEYEVKNTCCKYCLYYINAYGGWDSFLINGNNKRNDKITSYSYFKYADNRTTNFENKTYLNEVKPQYTLYTHYLTDDEASRMFHLLESTTVYLHDLESGKVVPVTITNKSCDYKTFSNNGKKKFYYTITVEESQYKMRK